MWLRNCSTMYYFLGWWMYGLLLQLCCAAVLGQRIDCVQARYMYPELGVHITSGLVTVHSSWKVYSCCKRALHSLFVSRNLAIPWFFHWFNYCFCLTSTLRIAWHGRLVRESPLSGKWLKLLCSELWAVIWPRHTWNCSPTKQFSEFWNHVANSTEMSR